MQAECTVQFSRLVSLIYGAVDDNSRWRFALSGLQHQLGATHAIAILAPRPNGDGPSLVLGDGDCTAIAGFDSLLQTCPFGSIAPRQVAAISDLMDEEAWLGSPFYQAVAVQSGIIDVLCIEIRLADQSSYRLRFMRTFQCARFGDAERRLAELLVPHLERAFQISRNKACERVIHESFADAFDRLGLASFVLDRHGRVIEQNSAADRLIADGDGLMCRNARLVATHPAEAGPFHRALRRALGGSDATDQAPHVMGITRERGTSLGLVIQRIHDAERAGAGAGRPTAIVYVRDPELKLEGCRRAAQTLFQLTTVESGLLIRLADGASLPEAAQDMHIRHTTARAHLRSIFNKTGTSRQSSLVRQVLNSVTLLADERGPRPALAGRTADAAAHAFPAVQMASRCGLGNAG
jgi:DNA-binding CsgD family transcriptional regulator